MNIRAGILSDTHLSKPGRKEKDLVERCFAGCDVIIHAGDLTSLHILDLFSGHTVYAVHGNMCDAGPYKTLPREMTFQLGLFRFGLTHGAHLGSDIESNLRDLFPEVDCMIYGHTHKAVCYRQAGVLIINPGSFKSTGKYGAPGTYAILEAGEVLSAAIHQVPAIS